MTQCTIISHRGLCKQHPDDERKGENTIEAFEEGIIALDELGLPKKIELDIHTTRDAKLIVIHDYTLDRTTNGRGNIKNFVLEEIQALDAGFGRVIPTLDDILLRFKTHGVMINIEIKERPLAQYIASTASAHTIAKEMILVSAFDNDEECEPGEDRSQLSSWEDLMTLRDILPFALLATKWKVELLGEQAFVRIAKDSGACAISPERNAVTPTLVTRAHDAGLAVNVWTVNDREEYQKLAAMGVDAVFSDNPHFLLP